MSDPQPLPPTPKKRTNSKTKRRATGPRRAYLSSEVIKMANLAGHRALDAAGIAAEIGETTPTKVRSMLHKHGVSLLRKGLDDDYFVIHWRRRDTAALTAFAHGCDLEPDALAVLTLRILLAEPVLFKNIVDEIVQFEIARTGIKPSR